STERFDIERPLGAGGMGEVYLAHDRERKMSVALKTMRLTEADALLRFKREFRALADISHQNLVSLYELVAVGEQWFLTMEPIDGVDFI
ncbi:MAG: protein kinase, partial [Myxococcota bacterium]